MNILLFTKTIQLSKVPLHLSRGRSLLYGSFQYNKIFTTDKSKSVDIDEAAERFGFEGSGAIADLFGQMAAIPNKQSFIDN